METLELSSDLSIDDLEDSSLLSENLSDEITMTKCVGHC